MAVDQHQTGEALESIGAKPAAETPASAPPIHSRFLFVDVAAMRAKQLQRGALPRINGTLPHKAERIAMEEVRCGLVGYSLPDASSGSEGHS